MGIKRLDHHEELARIPVILYPAGRIAEHHAGGALLFAKEIVVHQVALYKGLHLGVFPVALGNEALNEILIQGRAGAV